MNYYVLNEMRIDVLMNDVKESHVEGLPEAGLCKSVADQNQQTTFRDRHNMQGTPVDCRQEGARRVLPYQVKFPQFKSPRPQILNLGIM
jgi:hypothetical protein